MTEEMVGGQHQNDESDTDLSVRGEHTNANDRCSSAVTQRVCPEQANTPGKKLLQRPTSLEIPDLSGAEQLSWHNPKAMRAALILAVLLSFIISCSKPQVAPSLTPKFNELSDSDRERLDRQRAIVAATAKQKYGTGGLTTTVADLPVLQRLIDDNAFSKSQTYELQSLGVAFGDVLASELPLRWTMVTDEYGTDPTLRYKDRPVNINALTMISKRVERGEAVNLVRLLQITRDQLRQWQ